MDRSASKTALMTAAFRARETARSPKLFSDPWAAALAGPEGERVAAAMDGWNPAGELYIVVRTAYLDALIRKHVSLGTLQVVMLGAGFDTRAARLAKAGVRFFEVDHPETQADKIRRLRALDGYPVDQATYVSCDFEREDFLDRLVATGFDATAPAVLVWEGVTLYLTEAAVRATLRRIASGCHERSVVTFDFLGKRMIAGPVDSKDAEVRASLGELGEPIRWGTDDVLPLLYEEGFRHVHVTSFDEICLHLTETYARERKFRFQQIAVASRAPVVEP